MTGRKGPVTRPKGGASVLRTGGRAHQSFLLLRTLRAPDLLSLPVAPAAACSVVRVGWVREVFEYARCSGEGATGKATRPTGVLTLTRQKEPPRGIPPRPFFPGSPRVRLRAKEACRPARD